MLVQKISRKCEVDWLKHGNGSAERSFKQSYHMCNNLVFKTVISYFSVRNLGMHFVQIAQFLSVYTTRPLFFHFHNGTFTVTVHSTSELSNSSYSTVHLLTPCGQFTSLRDVSNLFRYLITISMQQKWCIVSVCRCVCFHCSVYLSFA